MRRLYPLLLHHLADPETGLFNFRVLWGDAEGQCWQWSLCETCVWRPVRLDNLWLCLITVSFGFNANVFFVHFLNSSGTLFSARNGSGDLPFLFKLVCGTVNGARTGFNSKDWREKKTFKSRLVDLWWNETCNDPVFTQTTERICEQKDLQALIWMRWKALIIMPVMALISKWK